MKKNRMLRLASMLMILTLLTTSVVGGTFAKYVTSDKGADTARVAKWGVKFAAHSDLFAKTYKDEKVNEDAPTATVKTSDEGKLVAPGTEGTGLGVNVTSTAPEVSYSMAIKLDNSAKVPTLTYTPTGGSATPYEPVKFSVYNNNTAILENKALSDLTTLFDGTNIIYEYDIAAGKYYFDEDGDGTIEDTEKGESKGTTTAPNIQIKWKWLFEDETNKALYNELDTILGNKAANSNPSGSITIGDTTYTITGDSINTYVALNWTITATQIN